MVVHQSNLSIFNKTTGLRQNNKRSFSVPLRIAQKNISGDKVSFKSNISKGLESTLKAFDLTQLERNTAVEFDKTVYGKRVFEFHDMMKGLIPKDFHTRLIKDNIIVVDRIKAAKDVSATEHKDIMNLLVTQTVKVGLQSMEKPMDSDLKTKLLNLSDVLVKDGIVKQSFWDKAKGIANSIFLKN